jgi:hypothetical protein
MTVEKRNAEYHPPAKRPPEAEHTEAQRRAEAQHRAEGDEARRMDGERLRGQDDRRIERVERLERVHKVEGGETPEVTPRRRRGDPDGAPSRERWSVQRERVHYQPRGESGSLTEGSRDGGREKRTEVPIDGREAVRQRRPGAEPGELERRAERPVRAPLTPVGRASSPLARLRLAVDYVFYLLYGLLVIRLGLALLGAREGAAFTRLVQDLTAPFYAPFEGIVARPAVDGSYLDAPVVIAVLAYALLHLAVRGLIRVIEGRPARR